MDGIGGHDVKLSKTDSERQIPYGFFSDPWNLDFFKKT
jgi:hypothetical protein